MSRLEPATDQIASFFGDQEGAFSLTLESLSAVTKSSSLQDSDALTAGRNIVSDTVKDESSTAIDEKHAEESREEGFCGSVFGMCTVS